MKGIAGFVAYFASLTKQLGGQAWPSDKCGGVGAARERTKPQPKDEKKDHELYSWGESLKKTVMAEVGSVATANG